MRVVLRVLRWLVLALGLLALGWWGWTEWLEAAFDARVEALRAAGEPVAPVDLARPAVPDSENAAPLLAEATAWLRAQEESSDVAARALRVWGYDGWTDADWREVNAWLRAAEPCLDLLARAGECRAARFELRWEDGAAMEVPAIPMLREAWSLLDVAAIAAAREGRFDVAVRRVATMLRLAELGEPPLMILESVRMTVRGAACEALELVARCDGFRAAPARAVLAPLLEAGENPRAALDALRGERAVGLSTIRRSEAGAGWRELLREYTIDPPAEGEIGPVLPSFLARPFVYLDGLAFLDLMDEAIASLEERPDDLGARLDALNEAAGERSWFYLWTRLYAVLPPKLHRDAVRHTARVRLARAALAVLEERQRDGAWPEKLDPTLPHDPFTGAPFRYETTADGARLAAAVPLRNDGLDDERAIAWEFRNPGDR